MARVLAFTPRIAQQGVELVAQAVGVHQHPAAVGHGARPQLVGQHCQVVCPVVARHSRVLPTVIDTRPFLVVREQPGAQLDGLVGH